MVNTKLIIVSTVEFPGEITILRAQDMDTLLKFIYSEKATKFCKISTVDLTVDYIGHI